MRSGNVYIGNGRLWDAGINGYGWPSTAAVYTNATTATAYYLNFNAMDVNTSRGPSHRWYGFSLRCLAD